jgi:hypothetical protein
MEMGVKWAAMVDAGTEPERELDETSTAGTLTEATGGLEETFLGGMATQMSKDLR